MVLRRFFIRCPMVVRLKAGSVLVLNDESKLEANGSPWSASEWAVKDADSDSIDAVQVTLIHHQHQTLF